jgi:hypothetical protein
MSWGWDCPGDRANSVLASFTLWNTCEHMKVHAQGEGGGTVSPLGGHEAAAGQATAPATCWTA